MTDEFPYEPQIDPQSCGAACLCMAYRALGLPASQADIWARVATRNRFGRTCTLTHRLAADALSLGLSAVVLQASHPRESLSACLDGGVIVIANHRGNRHAGGGHYSVVVAVDALGVRLHDPQVGPDREVMLVDWSAMWETSASADVTGRVLVAIGQADEPITCPDCGDAVPETVACPWCGKAMPLRPCVAVGCLKTRCRSRRWSRLFCPHCDRGWAG